MHPVGLAGEGVHAMHQSAEVGHIAKIVLDRHRAAGAVEGFLEVDLAVVVRVGGRKMPYGGRIRIGPGHVALLLDHGLISPPRQWLREVLEIQRQFAAHIAMPARIDAPQMADAFAMLRILAHAHIHEALIEDRRADDVVPVGAAAKRVFRFLGIAVEFPKMLRVAAIARGIAHEGVNPAIAAAEDHLRRAVDQGIGRARPLAVQHIGARRTVGPVNLAAVFVHAHETRRMGRRQVDMAFIHAVRGVQKQQIADRDYRAAHILCCETPRSVIMLTLQITSASVLSSGLRIL